MDLDSALRTGAVLESLDTRSVELASQRAGAVAAVVRDGTAVVSQVIPGGWTGAGHDASVAAAAQLRQKLVVMAGALETVALAVGALAVTLQQLQGELVAARRVLASAGPLDVEAPVGRQLEMAEMAFERADGRAAALIRDALTAGPLGGKLLPGSVELTPARGLALVRAETRARSLVSDVDAMPAIPSSPAAIAVWWAGLSVSARSTLTNSWPFVAGGLDGVPARVRDRVNRQRLAYSLAEATLVEQKERHPDVVRELTISASHVLPWPLSRLVTVITGEQGKAAARVRALRGLTATVRQPGSELLVFDAAGDGRAVVASGDVESNRSVAVIVPGMTTELADLPRLTAEGARLVSAAGAGTVAISWLGYDAPGLRQVISDGRAKSGAGELRRFTAGLRSTARKLQHVTVIGHSYGTLVAGIAARGELATDDLVLLASPGVEASRASQLHVPAGHVWAVRAATDPIQLVFWPRRAASLVGLPIPKLFGPDPAAGAFGARQFNTGGAYGHSGYFSPGSRSLDNLARIVSARPVRP